MPLRYVVIPSPISFRDPVTRAVYTSDDDRPLSFADFVRLRVFYNPLWNVSRATMRAADAIDRALDKADKANGVLELAEEDWRLLLRAVEEPRYLPPGGQVPVEGFNIHPAISRQLLPFLNAIAEAPTEPPKESRK